MKQVRALKSQLESGVRVKGQLNEWFATHRPEHAMDDIQSGRVTFLETDLVSSSYSCHFDKDHS